MFLRWTFIYFQITGGNRDLKVDFHLGPNMFSASRVNIVHTYECDFLDFFVLKCTPITLNYSRITLQFCIFSRKFIQGESFWLNLFLFFYRILSQPTLYLACYYLNDYRKSLTTTITTKCFSYFISSQFPF